MSRDGVRAGRRRENLQAGGSGREITLYRVQSGDSCILTASYIMNQEASPAFIEAEMDVTAAVIPSVAFRSWVAKFPFWQDYVFGLMSTRLASVMSTIEEVAFRRMAARLASHLIGSGDDLIVATHQRIATDLGSSREIEMPSMPLWITCPLV